MLKTCQKCGDKIGLCKEDFINSNNPNNKTSYFYLCIPCNERVFISEEMWDKLTQPKHSKVKIVNGRFKFI